MASDPGTNSAEQPASVPTSSPAAPTDAPVTPPIFEVCFSGGGFRATLFHLGVLLVLVKNRLIQSETLIVGVSGGAILAAMWALKRQALDSLPRPANLLASPALGELTQGLRALVQQDVRNKVFRRIVMTYSLLATSLLAVATLGSAYRLGDFPSTPDLWQSSWPILGLITAGVLALAILAIRAASGRNVNGTGLLQKQYAQVFQQVPLSSLGTNVFLTGTSLTDGSLFLAGNSCIALIGRYGHHPLQSEPDIQLTQCITASSAFPPAFAPVSFKFVTASGKVRHHITDGGVFDNLGVRALDAARAMAHNSNDLGRPRRLIVSDAGRPRQDETSRQRWGMLARNMRANDLMMYRLAQCDLPADAVHVPIFSVHPGGLITSDDLRKEISVLRTDLDYFSDSEIACLVAQGADNCLAALTAKFPQEPFAAVTESEITTLLKLSHNLPHYQTLLQQEFERRDASGWMAALTRGYHFTKRRLGSVEWLSLCWLIPLLCLISIGCYWQSLSRQLRHVQVELRKPANSQLVSFSASGLRPDQNRKVTLKIWPAVSRNRNSASNPLVDLEFPSAQIEANGAMSVELPAELMKGHELVRCELTLIEGASKETRDFTVTIQEPE